MYDLKKYKGGGRGSSNKFLITQDTTVVGPHYSTDVIYRKCDHVPSMDDDTCFK
jgi:hypothetical protein